VKVVEARVAVAWIRTPEALAEQSRSDPAFTLRLPL
jgi:hypothetical protein